MSDDKTPVEFALDCLDEARVYAELLRQVIAEAIDEVKQITDARAEIERLKAELANLKDKQ